MLFRSSLESVANFSPSDGSPFGTSMGKGATAALVALAFFGATALSVAEPLESILQRSSTQMRSLNKFLGCPSIGNNQIQTVNCTYAKPFPSCVSLSRT